MTTPQSTVISRKSQHFALSARLG